MSANEAKSQLLETPSLWVETVFQALEEAVFIVTPDRKIVRINAAGERMFGYSKADLVGRSTELLHVDRAHYRKFGEIIQQAFAVGEPAAFEFRLKRRNGEIFPSHQTISFLENERGSWLGIISVVRDLSDAKMTREALLQKTSDLEQAQRVAHIGSWTYDPVVRVPVWSDEMFRIIGMEPSAAPPEYEAHRAFIHPGDWERFDNAVQLAVSDGCGYDLELRIVKPDGEIRYVNARSEAVRAPDGSVTQLIGTAQDITALKKQEQALIFREKQILEQSDQLEKLNHALEILLDQRNRQIAGTREKLIRDFNRLIVPDLHALKGFLARETERKTVDLAINNINRLLSGRTDPITSAKFGLTKTELKIATMIRNDMTSKEIAENLYISSNTVGFHRKNLRTKLGIRQSSKSLSQFLKEHF